MSLYVLFFVLVIGATKGGRLPCFWEKYLEVIPPLHPMEKWTYWISFPLMEVNYDNLRFLDSFLQPDISLLLFK